MPTSKITKTFTFEGKRYYVYGKTDEEVLEKLALKKLALKKGSQSIEPSSITVQQWTDKCIATYKQHLSGRSLKSCEDIFKRYINKHIGSMRLKDVRPIHCQKVLNEINEGYSQYIINQTHQKMCWLFKKAVENGLIEKTPAEGLSKPKGSKGSHRSMTDEEQRIFLQCTANHPHGLLFRLMYGCGCRPSEAIRITYEDFFDRDRKRYLHIKGTKSKSSDRTVPVPPCVDEMLAEGSGTVCKTAYGNQFTDQAVRRAWVSLCRDMNIAMGCKMYRNALIPPLPLAEDLTPYCLRHTYCSNLARNMVDIRTAQYLMGHSDIVLTANIYTHITNDSLDEQYDSVVSSVV